MTDRDVIDAFVAHLRNHGHPGLQIERRPDEENRAGPDIDAIAGPFAIEHTSIDTLQDQRRNNDWFMRAVGGLEHDVGEVPPFSLDISIEYNAVTLGQDWSAIRAALREWLINEGPGLALGVTVICPPRLPFRLHILKSMDGRKGIRFGRFEPTDNTLPDRIKAAFERKAAKLANYKREGFISLLLVENNDIALMNVSKMIEAMSEAFPAGPPTAVDQVWFADTSIANALEFRDVTQDLRSYSSGRL